ncbi:MAG TPA: putative metallopeptidase, partial [Armatimonadota bacterium]|nr:putative metallopeptidase [Armatimonadota bacterium]
GMVSWAASAELVTTGGDAWTKGRSLQQLLDWFGHWWGEEQEGELPDFVLTFYAPAAAAMNDLGFCATCAHELRHCSVKRDRYGEIRYDPDDRPIWAILEHDVTEFLSVVEDFGPVGRNVAQLAEVALRAPRFPGAVVEGICGTCGAAVLPAAA